MFKYRAMTGTGLPGSKQLTKLSEEGWELVQIVPFVEGMTDLDEGEVAVYLRRIIPVVIQ